MIEPRLTTSAKSTAAVGVVGVPFDFDHTTIFDMADDATDRAAQLAHSGNLFCILVFVPVRPISFCVGTGQLTDARRVFGSSWIGLALHLFPLLHVDALWRSVLAGGAFRRFLLARGFFFLLAHNRARFRLLIAACQSSHRKCRSTKLDKPSSILVSCRWLYFFRVVHGYADRWGM